MSVTKSFVQLFTKSFSWIATPIVYSIPPAIVVGVGYKMNTIIYKNVTLERQKSLLLEEIKTLEIEKVHFKHAMNEALVSYHEADANNSKYVVLGMILICQASWLLTGVMSKLV